MNQKSNNILWVVLVIVIISGIYFFTKKDKDAENQEPIQGEQVQEEQAE